MRCAAASSPSTVSVISYAARSAVVASTAFTAEAMPAPAVTIAPAAPGTYAQEDAIVEIARAIIAHGSAFVGCVAVVTVRTNWWNADVDHDLRFG